MNVATPDIVAAEFNESNPNWSNDKERNWLFLHCQEGYANHILQMQGFIFLNDVFSSLGLRKTTQGQKLGWVQNGGGHVNFNISHVDFDASSYFLIFNVDGEIWERVDEFTKEQDRV